MAETKRLCADCDNVEPCDMLERCIKHDPAPATFDNYTRLTAPAGAQIEPCPVCAASPEVWQYIPKEGDNAQKVVMCSHSDDIGPHDALAGGGCPLYMPPNSFYRPTIREAVKHWNEYAKALGQLRRKNGWNRARVLRGNAGVLEAPAPSWRGLTKDEIDHAVGELVEYGTDFVAPLYSVIEGIERMLKERNAGLEGRKP